jgi:hypothetical protein
MTPHRMRESLHAHTEAADVIADLVGHLPVADAFRDDHADRLQALPQPQPGQVSRDRHLDVAPRLLAAVGRLLGLILASLDLREVVLPLLEDVIDDRLVQRLLVALQRQDIIRLARDYLLGDRLLRPHRVDRDDGTLDVHQPEEFGDRRDLVRFLGAGDLPQ